MKLFKTPAEKAQDDFRNAYEKGVRLARWSDASDFFNTASSEFKEAGMQKESFASGALSSLFRSVLLEKDAAAWMNCYQWMTWAGNQMLDVGFPANSAEIAKQAYLLYLQNSIMNPLNVTDPGNPERLRNIAQMYMELEGTNPVVWKLMKSEIDFQKRGFYFLALANYVEALLVIRKDPSKAVTLVSEAQTHMELATIDPSNVGLAIKGIADNAGRVGKCWFCGREVQGRSYNYVTMRAMLTEYMMLKYQSESPPTCEDSGVVACMGCFTAINNLADMISNRYYERAIVEMRNVEQRLNERLSALEHSVSRIRTQVTT